MKTYFDYYQLNRLMPEEDSYVSNDVVPNNLMIEKDKGLGNNDKIEDAYNSLSNMVNNSGATISQGHFSNEVIAEGSGDNCYSETLHDEFDGMVFVKIKAGDVTGKNLFNTENQLLPVRISNRSKDVYEINHNLRLVMASLY